MDRKKLIKHLVFLMFFIFLTNFLAEKFHWYFSIWYFDMIMHFLGGFWVGFFFLYTFLAKDPVLPTAGLFLKIILSTLAIGILWEFYEYFLNVVSFTSFDFKDTLSDIFFDLLGSFASIFYFFKIIMLMPENTVQLK